MLHKVSNKARFMGLVSVGALAVAFGGPAGCGEDEPEDAAEEAAEEVEDAAEETGDAIEETADEVEDELDDGEP